MGVDGREGIVQQIHIRVAVYRTCEGDARLLPATEVDPALAELSPVTVGEDGEVLQTKCKGTAEQEG